MRSGRIKRLLRIRDFELREVQTHYAEVLSRIARLEEEISSIGESRKALIMDILSLEERGEFSIDELQSMQQVVVYLERQLLSLDRQRQDLESYLEVLRQRVLERKKERDVVDKIKTKLELDLAKKEMERERKDADEFATQRYKV